MDILIEAILEIMGEAIFEGLFEDFGEGFLTTLSEKLNIRIQNRYIRWLVKFVSALLVIIFILAIIANFPCFSYSNQNTPSITCCE